jgi:hypothetical protein
MLMEKLLLSYGRRWGTFIGKYSQRPEFKSLGPDGSLCTKNTVGLLHPNGAPVSFPKALARLSDREIARLTELDAQTVSRVG